MHAELLGDLRALLGRGVAITIVPPPRSNLPCRGFVRSLVERDGANELAPLRASTECPTAAWLAPFTRCLLTSVSAGPSATRVGGL